MKKLLLVTSIGLMSSVLLFPAIIGAEQIENEPQVVIDTLDDNGEATSGHIVDDGTLMFESEPNNNGIQQRAYPYPLGKNIGGGTWHYGKMFNSNQAGSVYIHRSKKHSAVQLIKNQLEIQGQMQLLLEHINPIKMHTTGIMHLHRVLGIIQVAE